MGKTFSKELNYLGDLELQLLFFFSLISVAICWNLSHDTYGLIVCRALIIVVLGLGSFKRALLFYILRPQVLAFEE
jgi:CHASE2 domain-containing sensor protein